MECFKFSLVNESQLLVHRTAQTLGLHSLCNTYLNTEPLKWKDR